VTFDYGAPAALFVPKRKSDFRQPLGYRRVTTAAEAILSCGREVFPAMRAIGAWMQVSDERFNADEIHRLYESDDYPLSGHASD
jgi:hypothetical protein